MTEQSAVRNGHKSKRANGSGKSGTMFASLTGGIMARKGEAAPAPAHLDGVSIHSHGVVREQELSRPELSYDDPRIVYSEQEPVQAREQEPDPGPDSVLDTESIETRPNRLSAKEARRRAIRRANLAGGDCCELPLPPAITQVLPDGPRSTVTTRLDPERVRKLKIVAARMGTSNQKVMLAALDHYLDFVSEELAAECPCLARSMAKGG